MPQQQRSPLQSYKPTGCPLSCLLASGLLALLAGALYLWFPGDDHNLIRHALNEGAALLPLIPFLALLITHFRLGGNYSAERKGLARIARMVQGTLSPDPKHRRRVVIRGRLSSRPVVIRVRKTEGFLGKGDDASIELITPSPLAFQAFASKRVEQPGRYEYEVRYDLERVEAPIPTRELFERAPRLEKALLKATRHGAEEIRVTPTAITAVVFGGYASTPELVSQILSGMQSLANALQALADAPQALDLSVAMARRSLTTCPYCKDDLRAADTVACTFCDTRHHRECFEELGRCTVLGCGGGQSVPMSVKA